jgi:Sulfotransferase family
MSEPRPAPFVVGVGRSGTTLLRMMLDAHPQLAIPPETQFLPDVLDAAERGTRGAALADVIATARNWDDFRLEREQLARRIGNEADAAEALRSFYGLYAERQGKPRWGDKTPKHVTRMRRLGGALGEARFVHLIRDGRDVALSRRSRGMGAGKPMAETAELWRRRIERARAQGRQLRGRYLELRFEDLIADPEPALRAACALVELDYDGSMLDYHETAAGRLTELETDLDDGGGRIARTGRERIASHALATEPPHAARTGAWRAEMSETERREFESVAGGLLAELGYDVPS